MSPFLSIISRFFLSINSGRGAEGYPYYYDKVRIPVELDGKTVSAMAYVMQPGFACNNPSSVYLHTVRDGYQAAGFDQAILDQALVETRREMVEGQQWGQQFR